VRHRAIADHAELLSDSAMARRLINIAEVDLKRRRARRQLCAGTISTNRIRSRQLNFGF
jgi:hypothetical protein